MSEEGTSTNTDTDTSTSTSTKDVSFTPEQEAEISKRLKVEQEKARRVMGELEAIKARADLTASARTDLENRFQTVQKELLTKEELFAQEKKKQEQKYKKEVETLSSELDIWKTRYQDSTITRAIVDAAAKNEAFDSDAIVAMLRQNTSLIEAVDEKGIGTGQFEVKVKFTDPEGKEGPTELMLSPAEAVKRMTELPKYQYLFKGRGTGGVGGSGNAQGGQANLNQLVKDPAAYREARRKGQLKI